MLNKEAILTVANVIEANRSRFQMSSWGWAAELQVHTCTSAGCIGGWAEATFNLDALAAGSWSPEQTGEFLGLTEEESEELFFPAHDQGKTPQVWAHVTTHPYTASAEQAATLLRAIVSGEAEFTGAERE